MDTLFKGEPLSDSLLQGFSKRVATYDRENRFFTEDFEELKTGRLPDDERSQGTRRAGLVAGRSLPAAAALGLPRAGNGARHQHARVLGRRCRRSRRSGDKSLEWMLREAAAGEVFAAGHAERGNDIPLLLSTAKAERVDGGFKFTGHKMFGSLAPVWTRYGMHAMWADAEGGPKVVHAFMSRDSKGYRIVETWDTLGMRATRSDDVVLEGVFVPDKYVSRILPAGGADPFIVAMFAWALMGFANVYYGVAQRAFDLAIEAVKSKKSDRRQPDHGLSPGDPACGRPDGACAWIRSVLTSTTLRRSGATVSTTARPGPRGSSRQASCRRGLLEDRRPRNGSLRRFRHVQGERARAAVP